MFTTGITDYWSAGIKHASVVESRNQGENHLRWGFGEGKRTRRKNKYTTDWVGET